MYGAKRGNHLEKSISKAERKVDGKYSFLDLTIGEIKETGFLIYIVLNWTLDKKCPKPTTIMHRRNHAKPRRKWFRALKKWWRRYGDELFGGLSGIGGCPNPQIISHAIPVASHNVRKYL